MDTAFKLIVLALAIPTAVKATLDVVDHFRRR